MIKKIVALCCVVALALGLGVSAFAADSTLSLQISGKTLTVYQGGKTLTTYQMKTTDVTFSTSQTGTVVMTFQDSSAKKRNVSLGSQKTLAVSGTINSITLDSSLSSTFTLQIGAKASVSTLTVHSAGKVVAANDAKLTKVNSSNKSATIQTASGKKITATTVAAPKAATPAVKPTTPTPKPTTTKTGITLSTKAINCSSGDLLSDLLDMLNENVTAKDASGDYVMGECKWASKSNSAVNDDGNYPFYFYADMEAYEPVKGTIKIYTDGNSEDITVEFKEGGTAETALVVDAGSKLSGLTKDVKDSIYVENDNGDSIDYNFSWVSSSSTKIEERDGVRGYKFKIDPKNSRYEKVERTIYIKAE